MTTPEYVCANWHPDHTDCKKVGKYTCRSCHLVNYCGPACQQSHWPEHRLECRSPLSKETWQPAWVLERREPEFIGEGIAYHGVRKYLWGNIPAIDVLQLGLNEGNDCGQDLRILFAASGDLRNLVETIARLSNSYSHSLEATINDQDFDVVARNIIILFLALTMENVDEAIDCIIHLWYSAFVRESDIYILQHRVRPLIEDVGAKTKGKAPESLLAKTWAFGQRSLRIVLKKSSWDRLLSFIEVPAGLTVEDAQSIRAANTLAKSRQDYRDRHMCYLSPSRRMAFQKFREDGLLLPFGYPRHEFQVPNPTFFQLDNIWPMKDDADPLAGWSPKEVSDTSSGPASADMYGKLFFHIRGILQSFLSRLSNLNISITMYQVDARKLPGHLKGGSFDRIEVSNISDSGWLGIHSTLRFMIPLLQSPLDNPHATLITLFINAVPENLAHREEQQDWDAHISTTKLLLKYLPFKGAPTSPYDPQIIKRFVGRDIVRTYDHIFDRYSEDKKFRETADMLGAEMKERHTIVDKWPLRLKLKPGQPGAQDEFDRLISGGLTGKERYVEWKRIHRDML
ncbi:hypothetical protein BO94DRAFT_313736 [Aspergillus sclerotioniger CBS 115572]|uniref:MYND-type domain-containing protein n=1 Tax=Aspergillus sclerotioniger CBS 115572 TaxID=1450535 RepID=A0A317X6H2_9EURO|nr:hypothetical protein BO94DRAFT_313736 [Aspergillus sclerotioniger CBS 115572]PWY93925.1 hypothetical protein BO94DRAFT_313736 [Aspergillus sclerotioniger CBS 115572]